MSLEITRPRYLAYVSDNFHLILLRIFSIVLIAKKKEKIHRCNDFWFLDRRKQQSQKNNFVTFHPSKWMNVNAISHVLLGVRFNKFSNKISNFKQNEVYLSRLPRSFGAAMCTRRSKQPLSIVKIYRCKQYYFTSRENISNNF